MCALGSRCSCSLFQMADRWPAPCSGNVDGPECLFTGTHSNSTPPIPASWHVHVFFPNVNCTNCSREFTAEHQGFTYHGAMRLRSALSAQLNDITAALTGEAPTDPIDVTRAGLDPNYNQCGHTYNIVAGAPANFHAQPCIFEVDAVKKLGPFTDPSTMLGYPNYSFLLPVNVGVMQARARTSTCLFDYPHPSLSLL